MNSYFLLILNALYVITILFTIYIIIRDRGEPVKTLSWIVLIISIPIGGILLFLFFGQNFRKDKIFKKKAVFDHHFYEKILQKQYSFLEEFKKNELVKGSNYFLVKLLINNSKSLLTKNNEVTVLNNGKNTYESIIAELKTAQHHIHIEYYMIDEGEIADQLAAVLIEKAKNGVEIRLIFDDVGSWSLSKPFIRKLKNNGIEVHAFMPVRFPYFTSKINYRNHRKIIVIDGKVGFIGGINISDKYIYGDEKIKFWRDTHLKLKGDAVYSLQMAFLTDWSFVSNTEAIIDKTYFPKQEVKIELPIQITVSGPDSDWASIMQCFFSAISRAHSYVYIVSPYFMPNQTILNSIKAAALSGIQVRMLLPSIADSKIVYLSTLSYIPELLEVNVEVFLYEKGFNHSKILIVDGEFASVGSSNFDERSFNHNFEINAFIYNKAKVKEIENVVLEDFSNARKIEAKQWNNRTWGVKIKESLARLLSPLF